MPSSTFSVFLDEPTSSQALSKSPLASSHKLKVLCESSAPPTKENINPLTGLSFDNQPPLKKRKPSSSSALKTKSLPSSSKLSSKSKRLSSSGNKEKGKKRAVLGAKKAASGSEAEESRTILGNRRAYDFTVMPLADVTQAYDESEASRAMARVAFYTVTDSQLSLDKIHEAVDENDIEMQDASSKEAISNHTVTVTVA